MGDKYGRFFWSIINDDTFTGLAFRIGVEDVEEAMVFHSTLMIGNIQFTLGWVIEEY